MHWIAIDTSATSIVYDAAAMLPLYDTLNLDPAGRGASWGPLGAEPTGAAVVFEGVFSMSNALWTAIVPPGAGTVAYPTLPLDLAAAQPTTAPYSATVTSYVGLGNPFAIDALPDIRALLPKYSLLSYTLF